MQYNQWMVIGDQLPVKSPVELNDNSIVVRKTEIE